MVEHTIIEDENKKAHDLYYKLHKCLRRSLSGKAENGDELSCHTNSIVLYLAKSIGSGETWFDESVDDWCNYFLAAGMNNYGDCTQILKIRFDEHQEAGNGGR